MLYDFARNLSFLVSAIAFFGLFLLFGDALLLRFDLKTSLKSLGFLILSISAGVNFSNQGYSNLTLYSYAICFLLIFIGLIIDPHSKLKLSAPLILLFFFFLNGHLLLLALGIVITIAIFQLVYSTQHRDLIPLGVGFVLISAGEYFYYLERSESLKSLSNAGAFLYLFASVVLIIWLWSYLALRFLNLIKG